MENKRFYGIIIVISAILTIPLIAMQFTEEVKWSSFDFLVAGILLFVTGTAIELVLRNYKTAKKRFVLLSLILVVLFLVWAELAVGVFGTPLAGS